MAEESEQAPYSWTSLEPLPDGETEQPTAAFVMHAGRARVLYPNGDSYEGGFNDLKQKHGRGTYVWSSAPGSHPWVPEEGYPEDKAPAVKYDGQYVEGRKQGIGKLSLPNGDRYHGMLAKDKFQGDGTYFYASGDIYSGEWDGGIKQGEGSLLFAADGSQIVGKWVQGGAVSGRWIWKDGTVWVGAFKDNKPLGRGVFYFPSSNTKQEGEYVLVPPAGAAEEAEEDAPLSLVWRGRPFQQTDAGAAELRMAPISVA